jgi:hypothetical protein
LRSRRVRLGGVRLEAEIIRRWVPRRRPAALGPALRRGRQRPRPPPAILDRWISRHLQATDRLAHKPEDDPKRQHPASRNLWPMDTPETSTLVLAATTMIRERTGVSLGDPDGCAREGRGTRARPGPAASRAVRADDRLMRWRPDHTASAAASAFGISWPAPGSPNSKPPVRRAKAERGRFTATDRMTRNVSTRHAATLYRSGSAARRIAAVEIAEAAGQMGRRR